VAFKIPHLPPYPPDPIGNKKNSPTQINFTHFISSFPLQQKQKSKLLGSGELYDPEIGNVEDPPLKPMVICETETRMEKRS